MSFLSVLGRIWHGVEVAEPLVQPIVMGINPVAGGILQLVFTGITKAEQIYTDAKTGPTKKQFVTDSVNNALPLIQLGFQMAGKKLVIDQAQLSTLIDHLVAVMNSTSILTTPAT